MGNGEWGESTYLIRKEVCLVTLSKPFHLTKGSLRVGLLQSFSDPLSFFPDLSTIAHISSTGRLLDTNP